MTLIEAIVWIAVFTSAMIAIASTLIMFYHTERYSIEQASAIAAMQRGIDTTVRTIREASYASNGAYPIISIAPSQISFYANINRGDPYIQQVRFFVQGTSLMEGVTEPAGDPPAYGGAEVLTTLAQSIQNITIAASTFTYFDQDGDQITDYSQIGAVRFVTVTLYVDINTADNPGQVVLRSSAALRNLVGK